MDNVHADQPRWEGGGLDHERRGGVDRRFVGFRNACTRRQRRRGGPDQCRCRGLGCQPVPHSNRLHRPAFRDDHATRRDTVRGPATDSRLHTIRRYRQGTPEHIRRHQQRGNQLRKDGPYRLHEAGVGVARQRHPVDPRAGNRVFRTIAGHWRRMEADAGAVRRERRGRDPVRVQQPIPDTQRLGSAQHHRLPWRDR